MNPAPRCPTCGGPLIQKSRPLLVVVGLVLVFAILLPLVSRWLWIPAIIGCLTGLYLIAWGIMAQGRWCRQCKRPPSTN